MPGERNCTSTDSLASIKFESQMPQAHPLQLQSSVQPSSLPLRPLHGQNDRSHFLVPLITANSPDTAIATIRLSHISLHDNTIPYFPSGDDFVEPHYPFEFKSQPPRTPAGGFVSSVIKPVKATKTKTMGRWVEGENEEKAHRCVGDKGALERRKHRHLRRNYAPISMSLCSGRPKREGHTKPCSTRLFSTSALTRPTMPANFHCFSVWVTCVLA